MSVGSIMHVDLDAFFAAVELLDRPDLRPHPVVVARDTARSVVTSANYPARKYGLGSAMPLSRAKRLCPHVVVLEPHMAAYRDHSRRIMTIFRSVTPLVQPVSIDEAYLDVGGARRRLGSPEQIGAQLRRAVVEATGLTCSVGIASTLFLAKLASGRAKPDGLLAIDDEEALAYLHPLPVGALWGVGAATGRRLTGLGIHTVGDIAETPRAVLVRTLGESAGARLADLSHNIDPRRVNPHAPEKSVGHEITFEHDVTDRAVLRRIQLGHAHRIASRLRRRGLEARTVALKLRYSDFRTLTRSVSLEHPTDLARRIDAALASLLAGLEPLAGPVRLLGSRVENLDGSADGLLWDPDEQWRHAETTLDRVSTRFGADAVRPASLLPPGSRVVGDTSRPNRDDAP